MKILNVKQGSQEWHIARQGKFCASDAPAMMGLSKYETRNKLIARLATGVSQDIDTKTAEIFKKGHEAEEKARAIVEENLGDELYPIVCVSDDGKYLASMDGLTMDGTTGYEHKLINNDLRSLKNEDEEIPDNYIYQLEHQLFVTGAKKIIFVASDGTADDMVTRAYYSIPKVREALIAGWEQLEKDLAAYTPKVQEPIIIADADTLSLPIVEVNVSGQIAIKSNLADFGDRLKCYVNNINVSPKTDQDFANLGVAVKELKKAEAALKQADEQLTKAANIEEIKATIILYSEVARKARLACEKLEKEGKDNRKREIIASGQDKWREFINAKNSITQGCIVSCPINPDFIGATRGLKTIDSFGNGVDTEIARAKIDANKFYDGVALNLITLNGVKDYDFLFADKTQLLLKPNEDLKALIENRINAHKVAEEKKEAERKAAEDKRIADATAKAQADAQAKADREIAEAKADEAKRKEEERQRISIAQPAPVAPAIHKENSKLAQKRKEIIDFAQNANEADIAKLARIIKENFQTAFSA